MQLGTHASAHLVELIRLERRAFAAKMRAARGILGWSQSELGQRVGLTQRAIHKLEQGDTEPRRATVRAIDTVWHEQGVEFEDLADGGFRLTVRGPVIDQAAVSPVQRKRTPRSEPAVGRTAARAFRA